MIGSLWQRIRNACKPQNKRHLHPPKYTILRLEVLEDRKMLDASAIGAAGDAVWYAAARFGNDVATANYTLVNMVQSPQTSATPAAELGQLYRMGSELVADWVRMDQAAVQYEIAVVSTEVQTVVTWVADADGFLMDLFRSLSPSAADSGAVSGSTGSGQASGSNQNSGAILSPGGTSSGTDNGGNGVIRPLISGSPPTANNDSYTLAHDISFGVDAGQGVLANDTDPNHLTLSAVLVSGPSYGKLTLNSNGSFLYAPNAHWIGTDSFHYYATDGQFNSNTATVTLSVQDNGTIATQPDSYSTPHDHLLSVDASTGVLANDSDSIGEQLTANLASGPSDGTLQLNPDGSFTYTPNPGYAGNDSFQYTASDGVHSSAPSTVSISVTNTVPTASNYTYGVPENTTVNVTATNGLLKGTSDSDGDYLALTSWTQPSDGTLQVNPDGSFTYTPNTNYTGSDSFQYTISDGAAQATATVTLKVHATDTAPVANPAGYSVERNNTFSVDDSSGVLANDTDADGDPLTAALVSGPTNGTLTLNSDGSFNYTPNTNFTGTDTFTYKAGDGVLSSQPATVTLTVSGSPPTAADQTFTVKESMALNAPAGALMLSDSNPDSMTLTAQDISQPSDGTVSVNSNGSFVYTPNSGFTGSDSFTYDLTDGGLTSAAATATILVNASDTAPTATNLSYSIEENNSLNIDSESGVLSGASDGDGDLLLATLVHGPSDGTLTLNLDGSFTYTPNTGFAGADSFQYEVFDGTGYSNSVTVSLTVTGTIPTANPEAFGVHPNTTLNVSGPGVLANVSDPSGLPLTANLVSGPSHGSLTLNSDGSFSYTPNAGFSGLDSFTYQANDGISSTNAGVTLNVHTSNSAPVASNDNYSTPHNTPLDIIGPGVLSNDTDSDADTLSASLISSPTHGNVTLNSDGSFTYTPNNDFIGTDSFTYQANDGLANSNTATVTISVTDNAPSAGDDSYSVLHDQTLTVPASSGLMVNDSDEDSDPLTAQLVSAPNSGVIQLHHDGSFTYVPDAHYAGTDSFTYEDSDGMMASNAATLFISVTNAAPIAANDFYSTAAGQALTVTTSGVLANDYDADGDSLTAQLVSGPSNGTLTLNANGTFTYTPNSGFTGNDSFTYQATDGIALSNTATVTISVFSPNSTVPIANNGEFATSMNQAVTIGGPGVLWNAVSPNGKALSAVLDTGPANGAVTLNSDGSFTYTPNSGFTGDDSFTYYASAGGVNSLSPATVTIHVPNITATMANAWIPVNANDDNRSPITNMIPKIPDYKYLRPLPANDPQLQPLSLTVKNPNLLGFIQIQIQSRYPSVPGPIRLWTNQLKTKQIGPGLYPLMGPNALPATIYVEGVNPTPRTLVYDKGQKQNVVAKPPVMDNTITFTYYIVIPWMPGGGNTIIPIGSSAVNVGVTPVTQFFTINNGPVPPNPVNGQKTDGQIAFINGVDISNGYWTFGVNPGAPNIPVPKAYAATFNAQVFNANAMGDLHFVQNETITNGNRDAANAWIFAAGGPAPQDWKWLKNGSIESTNDPTLDMYEQQQPVQNPYYQSNRVGVLGTYIQIASGDSPWANNKALVASGLSGVGVVTEVAWTFNFTLYLIWSMPAGGGAAGDVIYTLATRNWSVVFHATANIANGWADKIEPASGVFAPGDFTLTHENPRAVTGPTANQAAQIR